MNISDISSLYNGVNPGTARTDALENTLTDTDLSKATDEELKKASKEFEAYFTEQVFKAMAKMVPESSNADMSSSMKQLQDYYKDEMMRDFAQSSSDNGGLGLAQMLYEQMKRNYNLD